jgi:phospholipid/cholesterol/gamma-HCH transport system permease protein
MNALAAVGRVTLGFVAITGRLAMFTAEAISHSVRPPVYWLLILQQMVRIGYFSLPVVGLTAFFTGAVLCLQIYIG